MSHYNYDDYHLCSYTELLLYCLYYKLVAVNIIGCLTDMGKVGDRGGLGQAKLGDSDHLCNLHNLPDTNAGGQCSTVEVPLL